MPEGFIRRPDCTVHVSGGRSRRQRQSNASGIDDGDTEARGRWRKQGKVTVGREIGDL